MNSQTRCLFMGVIFLIIMFYVSFVSALSISPIIRNLTISPIVKNITHVNFSQEDFLTGSFIPGNNVNTNETLARENSELNLVHGLATVALSSEGETCISWSGSYSYAELCYSDIFSSEQGNYVDLRCEEGDLYINPVPAFSVPGARCYDEYGQLSLCLCNNNGCSGTQVSGTYRYYFPSSKIKTIAALCYDKHNLGYGYDWAYRAKVYSTGSKISLEPDYYNLAQYEPGEEEPKQVNYSQVFPPKFNCTIQLGNYNNKYFFLQDLTRNLGLKFKLTRYGSTSEEIYSENVQCAGECTVYLPDDAAEKILPNDWVTCTADYAENDNLCGSADRIVPGFDMFLADFHIFNVIPFDTYTNIGIVPTLIQGKPFIARIFPSFSSDVINYMDKPVDITLKLNSGDFKITKPYIIGNKYNNKDFYRNNLLAELNSGAESSGKKVNELTSELKKIKKGGESLNIFSSEVARVAASEKIVDREIIINPENKISESNKDNNKDFGYVQTNSGSKELYLSYYDVVVKNSKGETLPSDSSYKDSDGGVISIITSYKLLKGNQNFELGVEFLKKIFPLPKEMINFKGPNKIERVYEFNKTKLNPPGFLSSLDQQTINNMHQEAYNEIEQIRRQIVADLAQEAAQGDRNFRRYVVVGLVDPTILGYFKPGSSSLSFVAGMAFVNEKVILISYSGDPSVLAHELGHIEGLYLQGNELYRTYPPFGDIADDGWCLEQNLEIGKSCIFGGPKINIWTDKNYQNTYSETKDIYEGSLSLSNINFGQRYFDIMGSASAGEQTWEKILVKRFEKEYSDWRPVDKSNEWIQLYQTYNKLYGAYVITQT
ncbi:hypothetical protein FJZ19_01170 [Candidatus Pacearchaeota archaeon]|nr:hypothetical protein [Candidatus Pacearchaeota archaeon]